MPTKLTDEQRVRAAVPGCAEDKKLATECCERPIDGDERYCPRCGWECRIKYVSHMADTPELPEMDVTDAEAIEAELEWNQVPQHLAQAKLFSAIGHRICRTRQLREAHATIAAQESEKRIAMRALEEATEHLRDWEKQFGVQSPSSLDKFLDRSAQEER